MTTISPSNQEQIKQRRTKGDGSGSIHWRKSQGKYQQAFYHYEFWEKGERTEKSTKYIPKKLLPQVQKLQQQKAPVREILDLISYLTVSSDQ